MTVRTFAIWVGCAVLNVTCVPPLKSIPRLSPLTPRATIEIAITVPEIAYHVRRRFMKSIWSHFPVWAPCAPIRRGLSNHLKPASSPSIARVAKTAVSSEITVPISSISAKPFTPAVATANRTSAVMQVTTLASRIVWKPFA